MDLSVGEGSELTLTRNKETETPGVEAEIVGFCGNEIAGIGHGDPESNQLNGKPIEIGLGKQQVELQQFATSSAKLGSPPLLFQSGGDADTPTTPTTATKGLGLRKWRRIRRDSPRDGSSPESNRILKRGLSIPAEPTRARDSSAEIKLKSEGSLASVDSSVKGQASVTSVPAVTSDSRTAVGSTLPASIDSENSEDRSSKSSTAASPPTSRYDVPVFVGASSSSREKGKIKNLSGKISGGASHKVQQGKSKTETSKKSRAERFKIEKENSYSSLESDSRSSNVLFGQMESIYGFRNGRQSEKCNYDGENSDEAHASEMQSNDYGKENGGAAKDVSQGDLAADMSSEVREEENGNHQLQADRDPLVSSILSLQSVQELLEREVEMFGELGQEEVLLAGKSIATHSIATQFASVDPGTCELNSSGPLHFEEGVDPTSSPHLEVQSPESNLEEATTIPKVEDSSSEYETYRGESSKEETGSSLKPLNGFRQMHIEVEDLIMQKIETEIESLVITSSTQHLKVATADHVRLLEEQKSMIGQQTQRLEKLRDAETNAVLLKRKAEELEESCGEMLGRGGVLEMQNRVFKFTFCFLVQLILLFVALGIFLLQLLSHSSGFVPT